MLPSNRLIFPALVIPKLKALPDKRVRALLHNVYKENPAPGGNQDLKDRVDPP